MSLEKATKNIEKYQKSKDTLEQFIREIEVSPKEGLKFLNQMYERQEKNPSEPQLKEIMYKRQKYRDYTEQGIPFKCYYDPQTQTLSFRQIH